MIEFLSEYSTAIVATGLLIPWSLVGFLCWKLYPVFRYDVKDWVKRTFTK